MPPTNGSSKSAYTVVDNKDGSINIVRTEGGPEPTPEELTFLGRVDRTDRKIGRLTPHEKDKQHEYSGDINAAARIGLNYPVDLRSGNLAMDGIEETFITTEGPKLRRKYLSSTIRLGVLLTLASLVAVVLLGLIAEVEATRPWGDVRHVFYTGAWIAVGIGVGMIFFAFVNSMNITYENIGRFDPSGLEPWLRLSLSIVVAIILCGFLKMGIVSIAIGPVGLNDYDAGTAAASIVCIFLGVFVAATDGVATRLISTTFSGAESKTTAK